MGFKKNGYSLSEIELSQLWSEKRRTQNEEEDEPIHGVAVVPYYQTIINRLARLLRQKQIRTTSYPLLKIHQQLRPGKDSLALSVPAVYKVPWECGASYVGQMGWFVSIKIKQHRWHVRLGQIEKLAIAHHCWWKGHQVLFVQTKVIYRSEDGHKPVIREALEIALTSVYESWRRCAS